MADFLSEDWFAGVLDAGGGLPKVDGLSFVFDIEVTESASGKVRGHGRIVDGRMASFQVGKFVAESEGEQVDVSFIGKAKRLLPVIEGEHSALVSYMRGELKIDGAYEIVVDRVAAQADRAALENFRSLVAELTDA